MFEVQHCFSNYFEDRGRIKIELVAPEFLIASDYDLWAVALLEQNTWLGAEKIPGLESIDEQGYLFIGSFLKTLRLCCELGRLPIFDLPKVISLFRVKQSERKYLLEIELDLIHFVPQAAYQIAIKTSLILCRWMAGNSATEANKSSIFDAITDKVIKPIQRLVPAGKSTIPTLKVAHSMGIPFMHLGLGIYQLGWGSKSIRFDRSVTALDSSMGAKLANNKMVSAGVLRLAGLPAPTHFVVNNVSAALSAAERLGFPVVVKPVDRERGEGVSVNIQDNDAIKIAFAHAHQLSKLKQVIIERHVPGVCHRLFIVNGRMLYAVKRLPISVRGDGVRSISQLVDDDLSAQQQKAPWNRSEIHAIDDRALVTLARAGFSAQSIPAKDVLAPLRSIESTADGGIDEEITTLVHPENLAAAIAAARSVGLCVAGVDLISPDISRPWHENGAIINEVNFAPLLGGGEISRSYIPRFFAEFIDGDGKIPVEIFDTEVAALERQIAYRRMGQRCYFVSQGTTTDCSGESLTMPFDDIALRLRALICRHDVDAIAVYLPLIK